jgi:hypothetical protein
MRTVRLARAAFDAQLVIAKSAGRKTARQAAFLVVAALFGLFALGLLHVAAYVALAVSAQIAPIWSALIVVGVDLLIAAVALVLARSGGPDAASIEARMTRDRALSDIRGSLAIATLTGPAGRLAGRGVVGLLRSLFVRRSKTRRR